MDIKKTLFELSEASGVGTLNEASDIAFDILSRFAECERSDNLTVIGKIRGESNYTVMLEAHIDEVSMIVTDIDDNGFLTVSKCGGIDLKTLPARRVTVHGKKNISAVFCSTPPHLVTKETEYSDISSIKLDTMLGKKAKDFINVGDYVTSTVKPTELVESRVTGKAFDDRAGVVCLLELAERLSGKVLPFDVVFVLSDTEELGMRGATTATFALAPDEAVAIDVTFADCPDISPNECGKLSGGAMIGISPVIDSVISGRLIKIAEENGIKYQTEIMGGRTGTDSDVISVSGAGIRTGLISIPIRNMHTDAEVLDVADIESVCNILEKYILAGGVQNA